MYTPNNKKIGDINEILLDKTGNVEAVVIGVGGFLGIGAKEVALPFKSLEWKMDRAEVSDGSPGTSTSGSDAQRPAQPPGGSQSRGARIPLTMRF